MGNTDTTSPTSVIGVYYDKKFLLESRKTFVLEPLGMAATFPKNSGTTAVWNRWTLPSAKVTAISQTADPTPTGLSAGLVSATLAQYGNYESISELLDMTAVSSAVEKAIDLLAYEAALSVDTICQAAISAGGIQQLANTAAARNSMKSTDTFSVVELRKAIRKLTKFAARPHTNNMYVATTHPDVIYDLEGDSAWVNAHIYTDKGLDNIYNGEVGMLYGTKFVMTQNATVLTASGSVGSSADIYQTHVMGRDFFGVSHLQNLQTWVDAPSKRLVMRQASDVAWKATFAVKVLNDSFAVRVESGASL